jgi:hypothetical protein
MTVKKPPSQRPERQGFRRYEVGKPYHPDRRIWPQGPQFNSRGGELVLFLDQPTPAEVQAVKTGRADFGLYDADGLVVLLYQFRHDQGGLPWSDPPYHYHLDPVPEWVLPPDPGSLSAEARALLHVVLVNATGGQIRALRTLTLSPEFTARLFRAIRAQSSGTFNAPAYDSQLGALYFQYPTSDQLAAACSVWCEGGA